jgi:nucleotide-binding universal stress UspA family protein
MAMPQGDNSRTSCVFLRLKGNVRLAPVRSRSQVSAMEPSQGIRASSQSATEPFAFDGASVFVRILVPVDFTEGSRRALATALELRKRFGSEVHLFRMATASENDQFLAGTGADGLSPQRLVEDAEARLKRFVDNVFPGQSGEVIVHAKVGEDVVHGVARGAKTIGTTLVLLADEPKQAIFRTQVEKLVKEVDGAVMILRAPRDVAKS